MTDPTPSVSLKPETCCHDKPLPCPFCGGEPEMDFYPTLTRVKCVACDFHLYGHGALSTAQTEDGICYLDIVNRWNKRASNAALEAAESALADARRDVERYAFIRDRHVRAWESDMPHNKGAPTLDIDFEAEGHDLDSAIDAAMGATHEG